ncbi:MAG: hypothetical protein ACFFG0_12455, partial [Candidatus Thorarchaeota archaeon]
GYLTRRIKMCIKTLFIIAPYDKNDEKYQIHTTLWENYKDKKLIEGKALYSQGETLKTINGNIALEDKIIKIGDKPVNFLHVTIDNKHDLLWIQEEIRSEGVNLERVECGINWLKVESGGNIHFYIAYHNSSDLDKNIYKLHNKFKELEINHIEFVHGDEYIYPKIEKLIEEPIVKEIFDDVCWMIKEGKQVLDLPLLKKKITSLFLSIDVDLRGFNDLKMQKERDQVKNEEKVLENYLKEVFDKKKSEPIVNDAPCYYRQKLADLWFIVTKGKIEDRRWIIDGCMPREMKTPEEFNCLPTPPIREFIKLLANDKHAIFDLILEKKEDNEIKIYWETLLDICGLHFSKDPFNKAEIYPEAEVFNPKSSDSSILQFMCMMDSEIKKYITDKDSFLSNFPLQAPPISFHEWFCKLDDCLGKLSDRIKGILKG